MDRRGFLTSAVVTGAAGVVLVACSEDKQKQEAKTPEAPAINKGLKQLKMVTSWPKNFPGLGTAANRAAELVGKLSEGTMEVKVYASGELVPGLQVFDAVSAGNADIFHAASYYWKGKSAGFNFFSTVPFGMTAPEMAAWIYYAGGQQLWDELATDFNLKPFMCGNTGVQMGGWFSKEINTAEDFNGLKMRIPGLGGNVLERMGATPVTLAGGDIFPSLQSGAIDATEWVGPWNDLAMGFYKVAKYYYNPGFHEPGTALEFTMNKKIYDGLSDHEKLVIDTACKAANDLSYAEYNAFNSDALDTLINEHGVQLSEFPEDVKKAFAENSRAVMDDVGKADPITKKIYESFKASLRKSSRGSSLAEESYMRMRTAHGA